MGCKVSYGFSVKVTLTPEEEKEDKKKKAEKELEEFIHRYQDFLKPTFVYDPLKIRNFMLEREKLLSNYDLGFREKMILKTMYRNVMEAQQRKEYELIGEDDFYGLWFL